MRTQTYGPVISPSATPSAVFRWSVEAVALLLLSAVCVLAPWGNGQAFGFGLTPVSAPAFALGASLPIALLMYWRRINLRAFDLLPIGLLLIVFASSRWTMYPAVWSGQAYWYAACVAIYLATRIYVYRLEAVRLLTLAFVIGALAATVFIRPEFNGTGMGVEGVNQNFTGYAFACVIYLLIIGLHLRQNTLLRLGAWAVSAVLAYNIYLLGTRGALISVGLMVAWVGFARAFGAKLAKPLFLTGAAVALLFSFGLLEWIPRAVEHLFQSDSNDLSGRLPVWASARRLIGEHPIMGVGAGAFRFLIPEGIGAHNIFLTLMLDVGLVGLLAFLGLLLFGLRPAIKARAAPQQRYVLGAFAAFFLPIASSGHIEVAPFMWIAFALTFTLLRSVRTSDYRDADMGLRPSDCLRSSMRGASERVATD